MIGAWSNEPGTVSHSSYSRKKAVLFNSRIVKLFLFHVHRVVNFLAISTCFAFILFIAVFEIYLPQVLLLS